MSKTQIGGTICARFNGFCWACKGEYKQGNLITKVGNRTWHHAHCVNNAAEKASVINTEPTGDAVPPVVDPEAVRMLVRDELDGATLTVDDSDVRPIVRDELTKAGIIRHEIVVKDQAGEQVLKIEGKPHRMLNKAVVLARCRKNILLIGPAGSGKTYLAEQVAQVLGLPFSFISCSAGMSEGQLLGRLVPTGEGGKFEYLRSEFVRCYEEGGIFLFDELDAADSNTLLVLNTALANGQIAIPNRPGNPVARKHANFVCIAAANTFGTGADRQYVGRNQLDESTLDRFRIGQIEMDYEPELEALLCPDQELRQRLQAYRQKARDAKVRRVISMRFVRDAQDVKRAGFTDGDIDAALFAGWSRDEIAKVVA
jgi:MoxR-like ATPase